MILACSGAEWNDSIARDVVLDSIDNGVRAGVGADGNRDMGEVVEGA